MANGANYWGNQDGSNNETTTPAIRAGQNSYPGKQSESMSDKDKTKVPMEIAKH